MGLASSLRCSQLPAAAVWLLVCMVVTVRASTECTKPCFDQNDYPVVLPKGLDKRMYSRFACLIDPSLDCRLSHEFSNTSRPSAAERGFPANSWNAAVYCPACDIYFSYCAKKDGSMNTGTLQYVHNERKATSATGHALVLPDQPCRGVESWENPRCGGEKAWDAAFKRWTEDGGSASNYFGYVMAVNSMRRRTRNQLHLHVGNLVSGVKLGLQPGHTWAKSQQKTTFLIACAKSTGKDITCKFDASKQGPSDNTIAVTIAAGTTPTDVKPFITVYGPNAKAGAAPSEATVEESMGVVASADKEWLILRLLGGAAECLMADSESQGKCSVSQPKTFASAAGEDVAADAAADPAAEGTT